MVLETITKEAPLGGEFKVVIEEDEWGSTIYDPREDDGHVWRLALRHRQYALPFEAELEEEPDTLEDLEEALREEAGAVVVVPVYGLDHSYLAISRGEFGCPWDSGVLGLAYVTASSLAEFYSYREADEEQALLKALDSELQELQAYMNGEFYDVTLTHVYDGEEEEIEIISCILGYEAAEWEADALITSAVQKEADTLFIRPDNKRPDPEVSEEEDMRNTFNEALSDMQPGDKKKLAGNITIMVQ